MERRFRFSRVLLGSTRCHEGNIHIVGRGCLGTPCVSWACYSSTTSIADTQNKYFDRSVPARPRPVPFEATSNPSVHAHPIPNAVSKSSAPFESPQRPRADLRLPSKLSGDEQPVGNTPCTTSGASVPAARATQLPLNAHLPAGQVSTIVCRGGASSKPTRLFTTVVALMHQNLQ